MARHNLICSKINSIFSFLSMDPNVSTYIEVKMESRSLLLTKVKTRGSILWKGKLNTNFGQVLNSNYCVYLGRKISTTTTKLLATCSFFYFIYLHHWKLSNSLWKKVSREFKMATTIQTCWIFWLKPLLHFLQSLYTDL